jgi:hypothetical protein
MTIQRRNEILLAALFAMLLGPAASAGDGQTRRLKAVRIETPPVIDGDLGDTAWEATEATGQLTQRFPDTGKPASFDTRIRVLYDAEALYISALCLDPEPDRIAARVTRRDRWIESDWFTVHLDSRHDRQTAFFFSVNAAGVKRDGTFWDEFMSGDEWDGVWEAGARITAEGWAVEMRIPLKLLRFQASAAVTFGLNFDRWLSRRNEADYWQYIPPDSGAWVSRFGELTDLDLPDRPVQIEVTPYVAVRPGLDASADQAIRPLEVGADGRMGLGSNFMLTVSANPDFGQVEVDQVVLNLSTVETYFPEKRPFFLEDRALFQTPAIGGPSQSELFYTRRIGRAARAPSLEDTEEEFRPAMLPRIWAAAKLAGQTQGRLSLGVIQAITSREDALVQQSDGRLVDRLAEPLTSASVLRVKQDFLRRSSAGLLVTALATPEDGASIAGGTDLQLELFDDEYKLSLLSFFSYLTEQRRDWQDSFTQAALEQHGAFGYGGRLRFEKVAGEHLLGSLNAIYYSPSLALNDLGYLDRADRFLVTGGLLHHRKKPLGPLARYGLQVNGWIDRNTDWVNLGDGFSLDAWADFVNGWYAGTWFFCGWPLCDDRETRSDRGVAFCGQAQRYRVGAWGQTSERNPVSIGFDTSWQKTERGHGLWIGIPLRIHPHPQVQLDLTPGYQYSNGALRWIDTLDESEGQRFLFADQHTEYWSVTLRGTLTFTTELTLQAYAQVFLAAVDHTSKYAARPRGLEIQVSDLVAAPEVPDDYDFTAANLNLNAILRWEYLPGSVFYLVYSGAFGDDRAQPEFRFGKVFDALLDTAAEHVLMLKITFLFS